MGHALAQAVFQGTSGTPDDQFVNTFHFQTAGSTVTFADSTNIITAVQAFYNTVHSPLTGALCTEMSTAITRASSQVKVYDMADTPPRVPVQTAIFTLGSTSGTRPAPNEVAVVGSFKATPVSGIPLGRLRGRVYVGPLVLDNWSLVSSDLRPNATVLQKLNAAMLALRDDVSTAWCVFSAAALAAGHATGLFQVVQGYVDDAADTQRRRGRVATTRTTWGP